MMGLYGSVCHMERGQGADAIVYACVLRAAGEVRGGAQPDPGEDRGRECHQGGCLRHSITGGTSETSGNIKGRTLYKVAQALGQDSAAQQTAGVLVAMGAMGVVCSIWSRRVGPAMQAFRMGCGLHAHRLVGGGELFLLWFWPGEPC